MAIDESVPADTGNTDPARNSVRPGKTGQTSESSDSRESQVLPKAASLAAPEPIAKRFIQVKNRYYFPDGTRAFTDRGNRLTTLSENTEVVRSLVGIAQARGWHDLNVRGTERFRREVWLAAAAAGLKVEGYTPNEIDQRRLARAPERASVVAAPPTTRLQDSISRAEVGEASTPPRSRPAPRPLLTGRLIDADRAPYRRDPRFAMSYFVKLKTDWGERVVWGLDLERALKDSVTKPEIGDEVGLRAIRRDPVKVRIATRGEDGQLTGEGQVERTRNRWVIEKLEFFESRAAAARTVQDPSISLRKAVQENPELVGSYLIVHAAELAAKRIRDPADRERFVALVRAKLADSLARGEPLPAVRVRDRAKTRTPDPRERDPDATRG